MRKIKQEGAFRITTAYIDDRGLPRCPFCNELVASGTLDYKQVERNGETYIEFLKFCSNDKCNAKLKYWAKINMDDTIRYSFDEDDIVEVKEDLK
jgi:hypothetical protein